MGRGIRTEAYFASLHSALQEQYKPCDCEVCKTLSAKNQTPKTNNLFQTALRAFEIVFKNKNYQPEDLLKVKEYKDLIEATASVFSSAIPHETPKEMKAYLEQDAFVFSGLKTHTQLTEARSFLKDEKGQILPYEKFEQKILKLNETYNKNYLEAEYQFAVGSSQSAANWANLQSNEDRYWLEYRTAGDEKVRANHQVLNGICLPKSDDFWTEYYPPNGWRCRCTAVEIRSTEKQLSDSTEAIQKGQKATSQIGKNGKNKLEMFRFNAGKEQKIFPPNNTYTKIAEAKKVKEELEKTSPFENISM